MYAPRCRSLEQSRVRRMAKTKLQVRGRDTTTIQAPEGSLSTPKPTLARALSDPQLPAIVVIA
jgi:hypothetical protein